MNAFPSAPAPASRRARLGAPLFLLLVAVATIAPMLRFASRWAELYDWRYFQAMEEVFRRTVVDYHQAPLWNPYACGGEVALANPQSTAASPTFLLTLLFGTSLGFRLSLIVYLFSALHGAYLLARQHGVSIAGSLVSGLAYGSCGWFAMHLSTGHINFAGAALYPYLLVCYRRAALSDGAPGDASRTAWIWILPAGFVLAWMAGLGGTYTVPMAILLLACYATGEAVSDRRARPILVGVGIGVVAFALGAVRLLPLLEFVRDHPRHVKEKDGNNALDVARMFLAWRNQLAPVAGHEYWWHEYCAHLPYVAVALSLAGALAQRLKPLVTPRPAPVVDAPALDSAAATTPAVPAPETAWPSRRAMWSDVGPTLAFAVWTILALALSSVDNWLAAHVGFMVRAGGHPTSVLLYRDAYHLLGAYALWRMLRGGPGRRFLPVVIVALGVVAGNAWPHGPWWLLRMLQLRRPQYSPV